MASFVNFVGVLYLQVMETATSYQSNLSLLALLDNLLLVSG